jgi:hypothetical protein
MPNQLHRSASFSETGWICHQCGHFNTRTTTCEECGTKQIPETMLEETPLIKRVSENEVAHILDMITNPPNRRECPIEGDIEGDFDAWFDGGAIRVVTGYTDYKFIDGISVTVHTLPRLLIIIKFANGESVSIAQEDRIK